jgi:hypothetical protein
LDVEYKDDSEQEQPPPPPPMPSPPVIIHYHRINSEQLASRECGPRRRHHPLHKMIMHPDGANDGDDDDAT